MNVLTASTHQQIEESLVKDGLIAEDELEQIKKEAQSKQEPVLSLLVKEGHITDEQLTKALAEANSVPYVNLTKAYISSKTLKMLPRDVAEHYMAVPLGEMQNRLVVAMLDADNLQAVDFLSNKIGRPLKVYAASETGIRQVLAQYDKFLEPGSGAMGDLISAGGAQEDKSSSLAAAGADEQKIQTIVQDSPVSRALSAVLDYAVKNRASDVHIEPLENEIRIRARIDGVLREIMKLPKDTEAPLVSRVKILSNLKIDEHRVPQDGQFSVQIQDRPIDLRVAISPVVWGEQIIMRLLDKTGTSMDLGALGYGGRSRRLLEKALKLPHGMVLTSGPTGSGKSTTMYAMVEAIKSDTINIVTLEDPVEYKMEGVNQIQVNPAVGLTFAAGLRSILRQDPDVILVGEIRDKETANLAVQAALTGHLVFSTLHTNSAAGILPRLLDMGIEPFLISSTVHTVIGQRLVRRVASAESYKSSSVETQAVRQTVGSLLPKNDSEMSKVAEDLGYKSLPLANQNAYTLVKGKSSPDSPTGYQGRMGIYEVFEVTEKMQDLIIKHAPSSLIQRAALEQGMVTMRQDGYLKALAGQTTLNEVDRVAAIGDES